MPLSRRRDARGYYQKALRLWQEGYHEEALTAAAKAIRIAPDHALAHQLHGSALSDLGRHAEALDALRQAMALDPALAHVQYKMAFELKFLGRYPEALDAFDSALRDEPYTGPVYFNRAQVLRTLGRYDEAIADYDQTLRLMPQMLATREEKGVALALAGQYEDAVAAFGAAAPGQSTGRSDLWQAAIAWHRENPVEARRLFDQAAGKPPGSASLRAVLTCALGDADTAAELLQAQAGPVDQGTRVELSGLCSLLGDPPMPGIDRLRATALGG